ERRLSTTDAGQGHGRLRPRASSKIPHLATELFGSPAFALLLGIRMMNDHRERRTTDDTKSAGPLLVVDGDSFAHRAYHGLPKSIERAGHKGGGAILGFANFLLRLYENERPRAVLVGWDTLDAPTYRSKAFPQYQSGRNFDASLVEQLDVLPQFV